MDLQSRKSLKIMSCYLPFKVNNPYAENVRRLLEEQGIGVCSIRDCLRSPGLFRRTRVFNFNWFDSTSGMGEYLKKAALLLLLKVCGKRIIYTLHNRRPHNDGGNPWSERMMRRLACSADAIVGLCGETEAVLRELAPKSVRKLTVIPHPNYIGNYRDVPAHPLRERYGLPEERPVFLFNGFISPYKNLEMLIDLFHGPELGEAFLLIAGRPASEDYLREMLARIANAKNIVCDFRYIPDEEIPSFYQTADLVVLPFHKESSLNYGAVYLSFSLKRTVICPEIGTIRELRGEDFVYRYDYHTEEEHRAQLAGALKRALEDWRKEPESLLHKGREAYDYVSRTHTDEVIGRMYGTLYRKLL